MAPRENTDLRSLALLWAETARHAQSRRELLELSNNYLESWAHARDVSYLPPTCQPRRMPDLEAVLAYAVDVNDCYRKHETPDGDAAEMLEALLIFTEAVVMRAALLQRP